MIKQNVELFAEQIEAMLKWYNYNPECYSTNDVQHFVEAENAYNEAVTNLLNSGFDLKTTRVFKDIILHKDFPVLENPVMIMESDIIEGFLRQHGYKEFLIEGHIVTEHKGYKAMPTKSVRFEYRKYNSLKSAMEICKEDDAFVKAIKVIEKITEGHRCGPSDIENYPETEIMSIHDKYAGNGINCSGYYVKTYGANNMVNEFLIRDGGFYPDLQVLEYGKVRYVLPLDDYMTNYLSCCMRPLEEKLTEKACHNIKEYHNVAAIMNEHGKNEGLQ